MNVIKLAFDEWMKKRTMGQYRPTDDGVTVRALRDCWAAATAQAALVSAEKDVEIKRLNAVLEGQEDYWRDRRATLQARIAELEAEVQHWKANHDNRVEAARFLHERTDLPAERIKFYQRHLELLDTIKGLEAEREKLMNEIRGYV